MPENWCQVGDNRPKFVGAARAYMELLGEQAKLVNALASPAEGMPAEPMRYDIDQSEDGGGLSAGGEDYVSSADYDALRAAASSIVAENQRLKESVADLQGQLNAIANEYYD